MDQTSNSNGKGSSNGSLDVKRVKSDNINDLATSLAAYKLYNPRDYYLLGSYIDCFDSFSSWRVGKIIEVDGDNVKVNFDGWPHRWDESLNIKGRQVAPFRKNTIGYTGSKTPIRDYTFEKSSDREYFQKLIVEINDLASKKFEGKDAQYLNQFLRGEVYIVMDWILTTQSSIRVNTEVVLIQEIMEAYINLFVKYLEVLPETLKDYQDGKSVQPMLYLVNENICLASAYFEIFEIMKRLVGATGRTTLFQTSTDFLSKNYPNPVAQKPKERTSVNPAQIINNINYFNTLGGFGKLMSLLQWEKKLSNPAESYKFPIPFVKNILLIYYYCIPYMTSTFKENVFQEMKEVFFERVERLNLRDLKDNDINIVFNVIRDAGGLFEALMGKDATQINEWSELECAWNILNSSVLEKRIKVMGEFNHFITRVVQGDIEGKNGVDKRKFRFISAEKLKNWFLQKKILDFILGDQFHVEIFKRSGFILRFLANQNALNPDHIDKIWKVTNSTQEEDIRSAYKLFVELAIDAPTEILDHMYSLIDQIKLQKFNEPVITLIKDFTLNAIENIITSDKKFFKTKTKSARYDFYGIKKLYFALQDDSDMEPQYVSTVFSALSVIAKNQNFKPEREKILNNLFDIIKKGKSVPQFLYLALHIFTSYSQGGGMFSLNSGVEDVVGKINKDYRLIDMVVKDLERYMRVVNEKLSEIKRIEEIESIQTYKFEGRYPHNYNIEQRLLFIEHMNMYLDKELTVDHMQRLWLVLHKNAPSDFEKTQIINWLTKTRINPDSTSSKKIPIINDKLMRGFFTQVLCDPDITETYTIYNSESFKLFEMYFQCINDKDGNIDASRGYDKIHKFDNLIGIDVLWRIFLNCPNESVLKQVEKLLVILHLKILSSQDFKLAKWRNFIIKIVECINQSQKSENHVLTAHIVSLLNEFVVSIEGRLFVYREIKPEQISFIVVNKRDESSKRTIDLMSNCTLFYLRKKIADAFGIGVYEFEMALHSGYKFPIDQEEDFSVASIENMKDKFREKDIVIDLKPIDNATSGLKEKFKSMIIDNQSIMNLLFELLGSDSSSLVNEVWELVTFLPTNPVIKSALKNLDVREDDDWFKLLDVKCMRKLLYSLQVLADFSNGIGISQHDEWSLDFIQKKGFAHLIRLYDMVKESDLNTLFNIKSMGVLLKVINFFLNNFTSLLELQKHQLEKITESILKSINFVSQNGNVLDIGDAQIQKDLKYPVTELITHSFTLLKKFITQDESIILNFYNFQDLESLFKNAFILCKDSKTRYIFSAEFNEFVMFISKITFPENYQKILPFSLILFINKLLSVVFDHRDNCQEFFKSFENLLIQSHDKDIVNINFEDFSVRLADFIITCPPFEIEPSDQDYLLQGTINLLDIVLTKKPELVEKLINTHKPELMKSLLDTCLFEIPVDVKRGEIYLPPKCKSAESRKTAFSLLKTISTGINEFTVKACEYLRGPLLSNFWRTPQQHDWYVVPTNFERSKTGYVGLKNLGCTCYMNSLLQQFFMIPDFRDTILETEDVNQDKVDKADNVLYQLKMIFASLKVSLRPYYNPKPFTLSYKDSAQRPINVGEQMDVDEFFNGILDKLEGLIKTTPTGGIIKRVFGGTLSQDLICKGCPHFSGTEEPFFSISLQVKNKKNLQESLQNFISGDMLDGDNAYFCGKCEKKVAALKRTCVKKLPNVLILVLKRFEFDYDTMTKNKVNDYCEFPQTLNMEPYTSEYLKKFDNQQQATTADTQADTNSEKQDIEQSDGQGEVVVQKEDEVEYPPEYYNYKLRGCIIHSGSAEAGHYYSLIKDPEENWFEFNDSTVKRFEIKELPSEAFGGDTSLAAVGVSGRGSFMERSYNAYMLYYERDTYFDEKGNQVPSMVVGDLNREDLAIGKGETGKKIVDEVKEDNFKFQMIRLVFDKDYGEYAYQLVKQCSESDYNYPSNHLIEITKYCFTFFLTVVIRAHDRSKVAPFLKELKIILKKSELIAEWFIKSMTSFPIIKEFLIVGYVRDMQYFVMGLVRACFRTLAEKTSKLSFEEFEKGEVGTFMKGVLYSWYATKNELRQPDKLFDIIEEFSHMNDNASLYLIKNKMVGRIFFYIHNPDLEIEYNHFDEFSFKGLFEKTDFGAPTNFDEGKKPIEDKSGDKKDGFKDYSINYNSLIQAFATLVLFSKRQLNTPLSSLGISLSEDEKLIAYESQETWSILMPLATAKKTKKLLSNIIAYLSLRRQNFTVEMFAIIRKGLTDTDDQDLKVYLMTLNKMMLLNDELTSLRIENGCNLLLNGIRENAGYFRATEILLEYLFKICAKNERCLKICSQDTEFIRFMKLWLENNINPIALHMQHTIKILKNKKFTIQSHLQNYSYPFEMKSKERLKKLEKVYRRETEELGPEYDSDDDFTDHNFVVGEKVDFLYDVGNWISVTVIDSLDEMVNLRLIGGNNLWVHYDVDKMAPNQKMQSTYKNKVEYFRY